MRKTISFLAILAIFCSNRLSAQEISPCSADEMQAEYYHNHPELAQKEEQEFLNGLNAYRNQARKKSTSNCDVRYIPTVVHVIYNGTLGNISDAKVQEMLDQCNSALLQQNYTLGQLDEIWHDRTANLQVELRLAKNDVQGDPTTGIIRTESALTTNAGENVKSISRPWDQERYLNIWVVASIRTIGSGTTLGYAYLPNYRLNPGDGIIVRSDLPDRFPTTLSHEVGHYLGLRHPFNNGCDDSDPSKGCDETGDFICDTPPRASQNQNCPLTLNSCSNDSPDERDQVENIMDYTSCRVMFTTGQKELVDFCLKEYRPELIDKENWFKTGVVDSTTKFGEVVADFSADAVAICQDAQVKYRDQSCTDINNTIYTWLFENGTPSISFDQNPTVTYKTGGLHSVSLIIKNGENVDTLERQNFINVIPTTSEISAPFYESFEVSNDFPLEGWTKTDGTGNLYWEITDKAASDGDKCLMLKNYIANSNGDEFTIELPSINFSTQRATTFNFDVAYARESSESDKEDLRVYVKDGCDGFDLIRFTERASSLASVSGYRTSEFIPGDISEWKSYSVDLSAFKNSTSLRVQIRFATSSGNNLYLDNFSLGTWHTSVSGPSENISALKIYPNPAKNLVNLNFSAIESDNYTISVNNSVGQTLLSQPIEAQIGNNNLQVNVAELPKGIYFIHLQNDKERLKQKLVIQ